MSDQLDEVMASMQSSGRRVFVKIGDMDEMTSTAPMRVELDGQGIEVTVTREVIDRGDDRMIALNWLRKLGRS